MDTYYAYILYTNASLYKCKAKASIVISILGNLWFGHISVQNIGKVTLLITSEDHY